MIPKPANLKEAGYLPLLIVIIMMLHILHAEAQNIGIGITAPQTRLDIAGTNAWDLQNTEGDVRIGDGLHRLKIGVALGGGGAGAVGIMQYGHTGGYNALSLGSQGNYLLSVFGGSKIVEIANISGGKTGIGTTPTILDGVLDINGRTRIRSGGSFATSAGIWLNNSDNSSQIAFMGMEDDSHVGFYGNNGAGWKFLMNTQTGALKINGTEGNPGHVLQSNGSNTPTWSSVSSWLFNNVYEMAQSGSVTIGWPNTGPFEGMRYTDFSLVVSVTSKLIMSSKAEMESLSCFACGGSSGYIQTQINKDGNSLTVFYGEGNALNGQRTTISSGINIFTLGPGTYTFYTYGGNQGGPEVKFQNARLSMLLIPQ